jgi:hypothetical protein
VAITLESAGRLAKLSFRLALRLGEPFLELVQLLFLRLAVEHPACGAAENRLEQPQLAAGHESERRADQNTKSPHGKFSV